LENDFLEDDDELLFNSMLSEPEVEIKNEERPMEKSPATKCSTSESETEDEPPAAKKPRETPATSAPREENQG
jgi:hypothetical protein